MAGGIIWRYGATKGPDMWLAAQNGMAHTKKGPAIPDPLGCADDRSRTYTP